MEKQGQKLTALSSMTLRGLIQKVNDAEVKKENVISILKDNESFIMLYYK